VSACSHAGLVDEGMYASMIRDYMILEIWNIAPAWLTFLVVLAIYRRQRIWSLKYPVNHRWLRGWLCLTCAEFMVRWRWQNTEHNAKRILEMEPENAASYVLLSNIYVAVGNIHLCENVEHQRKEKGAKKCLHLD
jgi:hypothetical protein